MIHWFSFQPTPYNEPLFKALHHQLGCKLFVHFREKVVPTHPWKSRMAIDYRARFYKKKFGVDWESLALVFQGNNQRFVLAGWDHPTVQIVLTLCRLLRRPYFIWTDTPPDRSKQNITLKNLLRKAWLRWILSSARTVFVTGRPGIQLFRDYNVERKKIKNLPFVSDLSRYSDSPRLSRKFHRRTSLKIISIGRINNSLKGHDIAIRALAKAFGPMGAWSYRIVGAGPDRQKLSRLCRNLRVSGKVKFLGWLEHPEAMAQLAASHLLIHPSPVHDPYPNAVLEGMAAGCVVLASDVSGSALDRIENKKNGLIHRAGDVDQLTRQLSHLRNHWSEMKTMARRARETAEKWPLERSIKNVLTDLLSSNKAGSWPNLKIPKFQKNAFRQAFQEKNPHEFRSVRKKNCG